MAFSPGHLSTSSSASSTLGSPENEDYILSFETVDKMRRVSSYSSLNSLIGESLHPRPAWGTEGPTAAAGTRPGDAGLAQALRASGLVAQEDRSTASATEGAPASHSARSPENACAGSGVRGHSPAPGAQTALPAQAPGLTPGRGPSAHSPSPVLQPHTDGVGVGKGQSRLCSALSGEPLSCRQACVSRSHWTRLGPCSQHWWVTGSPAASLNPWDCFETHRHSPDAAHLGA